MNKETIYMASYLLRHRKNDLRGQHEDLFNKCMRSIPSIYKDKDQPISCRYLRFQELLKLPDEILRALIIGG